MDSTRERAASSATTVTAGATQVPPGPHGMLLAAITADKPLTAIRTATGQRSQRRRPRRRSEVRNAKLLTGNSEIRGTADSDGDNNGNAGPATATTRRTREGRWPTRSGNEDATEARGASGTATRARSAVGGRPRAVRQQRRVAVRRRVTARQQRRASPGFPGSAMPVAAAPRHSQ